MAEIGELIGDLRGAGISRYPKAACAAASRAIGTRKGEQDT
jgi:hypothetical protein